MLLAIHDRMKGLAAWIIVILISVPFALWGIQEYLGPSGQNYAIKVNDTEVSVVEYERSYNLLRQQYMQMFNGKIPAYLGNDFLRKQAVSSLVDRTVLSEAVADNGFRVGDAALIDSLESIPQFKVGDKFDADMYKSQLQSMGYSQQGFESNIKSEVASNQLQLGIVSTSFVTDKELDNYIQVYKQTRKIDYVNLPYDKYASTVQVTDSEIKTYYDEHSTELTTQEKVSIEYIELDGAQIAKEIPVDEATLKQIYEDDSFAGAYSSEEIRTASHILIKVPADATDEVKAEKRAKLEGLLNKINAGESFAKIAEAESEDPGSASKGGSLGEVRRGIMVKPFEEALFALEKKGQLSDIVKTNYGFHVIKLDDLKPSVKASFAKVRDQLEEDYRNREFEKIFYDRVEVLKNLLFENSETLDIAAEELELTVGSTAEFTRASGPGLASKAEIRAAAFSDEVLIEGLNSDLIDLGNNHLVALRIKHHEQSRVQTMQEARAKVAELIKAEKVDEALQTAATELGAKIQEQGVSKKLAKTYKGELQKDKTIKRDAGSEVPFDILNKALTMPTPEADQLSVDHLKLSSGDYVVIALRDAELADAVALKEEERKVLSNQLFNVKGKTAFNAALQRIKDSAEVVVNSDLRE